MGGQIESLLRDMYGNGGQGTPPDETPKSDGAADDVLKMMYGSGVQQSANELIQGLQAPFVREATNQPRFPSGLEQEAQTSFLPGETRRAFMERTAQRRADLQELNTRNVVRQAPTGWEAFKERLGNLRIFEYGSQPGIDVGGVPRFFTQIFSPTIGKALEGDFRVSIDNSWNMVGGIGKGLWDATVGDAASIAFDAASGYDRLLPEEREEVGRRAIANYAGMLVGMQMSRIFDASKIGILGAGVKNLEGLAPSELAALSQARVPMGFMGRFQRGMVSGVVGGAATGVIEGGGLEPGGDLQESTDRAATYALLAVPLGLAFEAWSARDPNVHPLVGEQVVKSAQDLYYLKQLHSARTLTVTDFAKTAYALNTQRDLARAALRMSEDRPIVVSGLTGEDVALIQRDIRDINKSTVGEVAANTPNAVFFKRPDGMFDMLRYSDAVESSTVVGAVDDRPFRLEGESDEAFSARVREYVRAKNVYKRSPEAAQRARNIDRRFFEIGGHIPGSTVSFLGQEYTYVDPVFAGPRGILSEHVLRDAAGNEIQVPWNMVQRGADHIINSWELDRVTARNALYNDFKSASPELFNSDGSLIADSRADLNSLVERYAKNRNLPTSEANGLRDFLEGRLADDLRQQSMHPDENAAYVRVLNESRRMRKTMAEDLVTLAYENGYQIERTGGSGIVLRDLASNSVVGRFNSIDNVRKFIFEAGGAVHGPDLGGGKIPPVGRGMPTAPPPFEGNRFGTFNFREDGVLRQFSHWFNTTLLGTRLTGMRQIMISLDSQLGTDFASRVWYPVHTAFMQKHANAYADIKRAAGIANMTRGMSADELEHVANLLETMSAEQIPQFGGLFKNRAFTSREIAGAQWFIDNKVDIKKAFAYRRALTSLEMANRDHPELPRLVRELQARMGTDEATVEAARVMSEVLKKGKPQELSLYGIIRLANATMNGDMSYDAYIAHHKLNPRIVEVAQQIRSQLDELADKFDLPDAQRLNQYFAHYREYDGKPPINATEADEIPIFVNELLRTGEMDEYDRDPINMLVRYINAGYNRKYVKEAWDNAFKYVEQASARIGGNDGRFVENLLKKYYLHEIRGIPHDSSGFAQGLLDKFLERIGIKSTVNTRRDLVNTFLSLSSSASIGFRPVQGIRDATSAISLFFSRFGSERTGDMLAIISRYSPEQLKEMGILENVVPGEGVSDAMRREGVIPTISPVSVLSAEERLENSLSGKTARFREIIQNLGEQGIKWGLQHTVYEWLHAATYLESYTRALKVLNDLVHDNIGGEAAKAKAYSALAIDSYDLPVAKEFDRLVRAGKFEDAAKFLGHASSFETVSVFGLANHPAGWGTNTGRMLGQFGTWPVWARSQMMRLAGRGGHGGRSAALGRFALSQGALKAASWSLGLNLNNWYLPFAAPIIAAGDGMYNAAQEYDTRKQLEGFGKALVQGTIGTIGAGIFGGGPAVGLAADAMALGNPQTFDDQRAYNDLARSWMLGVPGSFLAQDVYEASKLASAGYNPFTVLARAFGIRSTQDPSLLNPYGIQLNRANDPVPVDPEIRAQAEAQFAANVKKPTPELLAGVTTGNMLMFGMLAGMIGQRQRFGIELEFNVKPKMDEFGRPMVDAYGELSRGAKREVLEEYYEAFPEDKEYDSGSANDKDAGRYRPVFTLKHEVSNAIELNYGPAELNSMDLDGLMKRLAWLRERTTTGIEPEDIALYRTHKVSDPSVGSMHIHVSPRPTPELGGYNSSTPTYHREDTPFTLPHGFRPFFEPVRASRHGTIEYRNMLTTYDIDEIVSRVNTALENTARLIEERGTAPTTAETREANLATARAELTALEEQYKAGDFSSKEAGDYALALQRHSVRGQEFAPLQEAYDVERRLIQDNIYELQGKIDNLNSQMARAKATDLDNLKAERTALRAQIVTLRERSNEIDHFQDVISNELMDSSNRVSEAAAALDNVDPKQPQRPWRPDDISDADLARMDAGIDRGLSTDIHEEIQSANIERMGNDQPLSPDFVEDLVHTIQRRFRGGPRSFINDPYSYVLRRLGRSTRHYREMEQRIERGLNPPAETAADRRATYLETQRFQPIVNELKPQILEDVKLRLRNWTGPINHMQLVDIIEAAIFSFDRISGLPASMYAQLQESLVIAGREYLDALRAERDRTVSELPPIPQEP